MTQTTKNSAKPAIELMPPSILVRVGRRRLTLTWRPRLRLPSLLSGLLRRSFRRVLAPALKVSIAAAAVCGAWQMPAMAAAPAPGTLPAGWSVVNGNVTFTQNGNTLNINQLSPQAIANFVSFSIGSDATVNVNQPSSLAALLARVTGGDISQIYGKLAAPGTVVLYNPNGLLIGPGGMVDVGRFIGTTLNISDSDFLAGKFNFAKQGNAGAVDNQGTIQSATGGSVYLIGSSVSNSGVIKSAGGEVILGAGDTVTLADTATPGVTVKVTGSAGNVTNLGTITADAGRIGVAAGLINNSGVISASSVVKEGGRIFLRAAQKLTTTATSSITADGTAGGNVTLYSDGAAYIDGDVSATGAAGRGGFVETSGLKQLDVVKAPTVGSGGTWYIDPYDLEVVAPNNIADYLTNIANVITSTGGTSRISNGTINTLLNLGANVTLATGAGGPANGGNLTINAAISKTSGSQSTLKLNADNNIFINANITSTSGALNVTARTNYNDAVSGAHSVVIGGGANVSLNGGLLQVNTGSTGIGNGALTVATDGKLDLGMYGGVQAGSLVVNGRLESTYQASVNVSGNITNTGYFNLQNGELRANNVTNSVNGTFNLTNVSGVVANLVNNGSMNLNNLFRSFTTSGITNNAGGTAYLLGGFHGSDSLGDLTNYGTMVLQNVSNLKAGVISNNGTGQLSVNGTVNAAELLNLGGTLTLNEGATVTVDNGMTNNATLNINGSGSLTSAGTVTNAVNGTIAFGGTDTTFNTSGAGTWINNGNIVINGGNQTLSLSNTGGLENRGNLTVNGNALLVATGSTPLDNYGNVTQTAGSRVQAGDINNQQGGLWSGNGTIQADGTFTNDGTVAPGGNGTIGALTFQGNFSQSETGSLLIDIGSATNDTITFNSSSVAMGGTLQTTLVGNAQPALNYEVSPFTFVGGVDSLNGSYFRYVKGTILNDGSGMRMMKAVYGGRDAYDGIKLVMLGSEDITTVGDVTSWNDRYGWSTGYIPTAIDTVIIDGNRNLETPLYHSSGNDTINKLVVNGDGFLALDGGNLTVSSLTTLDGQINASKGAQLTLNGTLSGNGKLSISGYPALRTNSVNSVVSGDLPGTTVNLKDAASAVSIDIDGGLLNFSGSVRLAGLNVSSGNVTGAAGSRLNVSESFSQSGGTLTLADAALSSNSCGTLSLGDITANNLVIESQAGGIDQMSGTSLHVKTQLIAKAVNGIDLSGGADNQIAAFAADNSGQGDIKLTNRLNSLDTNAVILNGISTATGNVTIDNTGAMQTAAIGSKADFLATLPTFTSNTAAAKLALLGINTTGQVKTVSGDVTLVTHSPLTIGSGGVSAGGNIGLTAGASNDPTSNLVINGVLSGANVNVTAGNNLNLNANVVATGSYTPSADGTYTVASGVSITTASGTTIPNPAVPSSTSTSSSSSSSSSSGNSSTVVTPTPAAPAQLQQAQQVKNQQAQSQQAQSLQSTVSVTQVGSGPKSSGDVQQSGGTSQSTAGSSFGEEGSTTAPKKLPMCT